MQPRDLPGPRCDPLETPGCWAPGLQSGSLSPAGEYLWTVNQSQIVKKSKIHIKQPSMCVKNITKIC